MGRWESETRGERLLVDVDGILTLDVPALLHKAERALVDLECAAGDGPWIMQRTWTKKFGSMLSAPESGVVDAEPEDEDKRPRSLCTLGLCCTSGNASPGPLPVGPHGARRLHGQGPSRGRRPEDRRYPRRLQGGDDRVWPATPVRDVIEETKSNELETGILIGLANRRGVTVRMPDDGGGQEWALAARYRKDAKATALD